MKVWHPRASASNCDRLATAYGGRRSADRLRERENKGGVEGGGECWGGVSGKSSCPWHLVGMQTWDSSFSLGSDIFTQGVWWWFSILCAFGHVDQTDLHLIGNWISQLPQFISTRGDFLSDSSYLIADSAVISSASRSKNMDTITDLFLALLTA